MSTVTDPESKRGTWAFLKDFPRVMPYLRPHKRLAGMSLGMVLLSTLMALLAPWPLALLIDTVLGNKPLPSLLGALDGLGVYTLLAVAVASGLIITALEHGLAVVDDYVNTKLDQNMVLDLRSDLFRHAQRLSMAFHDTKRTGTLMYQINNQAAAVGGVTVAVPPLLQSILTLIGMFAVTLVIEPLLALLALTRGALHLLLGRLLHPPHRAGPDERAQARGPVAHDRPRGDGDAQGDRGLRPRGLRVRPLSQAGRGGGQRARSPDRATDAVLAGRDDDHRRRQRARARLRAPTAC
jgi:ABC-type multidrug transport system fused ATPase/permease subunit